MRSIRQKNKGAEMHLYHPDYPISMEVQGNEPASFMVSTNTKKVHTVTYELVKFVTYTNVRKDWKTLARNRWTPMIYDRWVKKTFIVDNYYNGKKVKK